MQFEQLAALAAFGGFFRGGEFALGQRDAALHGDDLDGFGKADIFDLPDEGEDVSRCVGNRSSGRTGGAACTEKEGGFLFVEGAEAGVVLRAGLFRRTYSPMILTMSACCFTVWAKLSDTAGDFESTAHDNVAQVDQTARDRSA